MKVFIIGPICAKNNCNNGIEFFLIEADEAAHAGVCAEHLARYIEDSYEESDAELIV